MSALEMMQVRTHLGLKVGVVNKIAYTKLQYMKLHLKHLCVCE